MIRNHTLRAITSLLLLSAAASLPAQEPMAPKPAKAKPGKAEAAPAGPKPVDQFTPTAAAIQTILDSNPTTPSQLFHAAELLANLGRPDLGKVYLQQILKANPDQAALASIHKQNGGGEVLRVAQNRDLAPEGAQVADAVLKALADRARDRNHLATQASRLSDPSPKARVDAMRELRSAGTAAVAPLVAILADPQKAAQHNEVKNALVELGEIAAGPLLGVLESDDAPLKVQVIEVLGRLEAKEAMLSLFVPFVSPKSTPELRESARAALLTIAGKMPTVNETEIMLRKRAAEYFDRQRPLKADIDGRVELWQWDAQTKQSVPVQYLADEASAALAGRVARDLLELFPDNLQYRRWHLVGIMDGAAYRAGLDQPVAKDPGSPYDVAKQQPVRSIEDALEYAIAQDHIPAATVAAQLLGEIGHVNMLTSNGASPCPLVAAAGNADRRLRYAALDSIMRLGPTKAFPGSSVVPEALGYFVRSYGARRAVVGHASAQQGEELSALLREQGYDPILATNGRDVLMLANSTPDVELVLISATIDRPTMQPLLQQLRHDRRTALLPVGLLATPFDDTEAVKITAEGDPLAEGFPQPTLPLIVDNKADNVPAKTDAKAEKDESKKLPPPTPINAMPILVQRLQARAGRLYVPPEVRQQEAKGALEWLAALARKDDKPLFDAARKEAPLFDVRQQEPAITAALRWPEVAPAAAKVLGMFGTATSQRALVELASREMQPLIVRQAAASAFGDSVERFGIRLTKPEILTQYARYNQSARADRGTQAVLGLILDALESKQQ